MHLIRDCRKQSCVEGYAGLETKNRWHLFLVSSQWLAVACGPKCKRYSGCGERDTSVTGVGWQSSLIPLRASLAA